MVNHELALHPVRLRILMAVAGRQLTVQQMAKLLDGIPQATLYRHVNALADCDILQVVSENPVRGTTEKVYMLNPAEPVVANLCCIGMPLYLNDCEVDELRQALMEVVAHYADRTPSPERKRHLLAAFILDQP
jgi:DNA-binding transcriptional ArsR family regulator